MFGVAHSSIAYDVKVRISQVVSLAGWFETFGNIQVGGNIQKQDIQK